jgi:hypothetical protein
VSAIALEAPPTPLLRRGLLALVGFSIAGTTVELVFLHHWSSAGQNVVWPAIGALAFGTLYLAVRRSRRSIAVARSIAIVVGLVALVGLAFHVNENLAAGPLDRNYAATWDTLSSFDQLWLAVTGGVGPAPTLAPGVLIQLGAGLFLASFGYRPTRVVDDASPGSRG